MADDLPDELECLLHLAHAADWIGLEKIQDPIKQKILRFFDPTSIREDDKGILERRYNTLFSMSLKGRNF